MSSNRIGIDFIGLPKGSLGVGEQTRCLIRLAEANDYAINVIDCHQNGDSFKNNVSEFDHYISREFRHGIRIYSATHAHIISLLWRYGFNFFNNPKNIFHMAWEFQSITPELKPIISLCDEVWGVSKFTADAFSNNYGVPVAVMPNSIDWVDCLDKNRGMFSLPQQSYLFSTSFDFNSFITRKNPNLTVRAFIENFADMDDVGLVVKIINGDPGDFQYKKFIESIQGHKNIYVIDKVFDKRDVLLLFNSCDAYISLHRSEGFGLGIAENMMLGKPVICTGYSGNMDFCTRDNSYLVDYSIVEVSKGSYPNSEGLVWAEPNPDSAARLIGEVYANQELSRVVGKKGREMIRDSFCTQAVSSIFKKRIELINLSVSTH